jgi:hypothetical protein
MGVFVTILELLIRIVEMVQGSTIQSLYQCIFISEILGQIYGLAVDNFAIFSNTIACGMDTGSASST